MNSQPSAPLTHYSEKTALFDDPIVAEVRQARMEILESFGGDLEAMLRDVIRRQDERKQRNLDPENRS